MFVTVKCLWLTYGNMQCDTNIQIKLLLLKCILLWIQIANKVRCDIECSKKWIMFKRHSVKRDDNLQTSNDKLNSVLNTLF
jgi:hypothetical protein